MHHADHCSVANLSRYSVRGWTGIWTDNVRNLMIMIALYALSHCALISCKFGAAARAGCEVKYEDANCIRNSFWPFFHFVWLSLLPLSLPANFDAKLMVLCLYQQEELFSSIL